MFRAFPFVLALLLPVSSARAQTDAPNPSPLSAETVSLQGFAGKNPACVEWNDGCATCRRSPDVHCSTPGIACQPGAIVCKAP